MSGLNASLGYFVSAAIFAALVRTLFKKWPRLSFMLEFASSFMLVACLLEVQTIVEVGEWAGGLGPDVTLTVRFVVLLTHGIICGSASGNPTLVVLKFLQREATTLPTLLAVAAQFLGAHLALLVALYYWSLELTDMHMIKNLMARDPSKPATQISPDPGAADRSPPHFPVPYSPRLHLSYMSPSLSYGLTFHCPGFTFTEYAVVYWLGSLTGMILALFLYMGHIPRIFSKNLLYSQKTRQKTRVPKGDKAEKKKQ
ncbi:Aquaporin-12 [Dissostichus eleginoides]|uniref:Aquaporin-12 n=1 Tax=Dissostichus eleginoides TaxID=100907 RepID=A0AAD9CCG9_DISEL|nr:Aquaporin-12 [Dissostichus eleginoides]